MSYGPLRRRPISPHQCNGETAGNHRRNRMIDLKAIDDLARRLSDLVPPGLKDARAEIEQNMKSTLQAGLAKLDLVTREEFEVQRAVLLRTREKIDALERTLQILEARLATPSDSSN
jgi:ubiquinone biosynthesis accessory factor UbiK